jgi:hypothetical protein
MLAVLYFSQVLLSYLTSLRHVPIYDYKEVSTQYLKYLVRTLGTLVW